MIIMVIKLLEPVLSSQKWLNCVLYRAGLAGSVLKQSWQVVAANEGAWSFQLQIETLLALLLAPA